MTPNGERDVQPGECLYCYETRMLDEYGCAGEPMWFSRWVAGQEHRHGAAGRPLPDTAADVADGRCDCDVYLMLEVMPRRSARQRGLRCARDSCG